MGKSTERGHERYRKVSRHLHKAGKSMRVLSRLNWPGEIRDSFLAGGAKRLPQVAYEAFDPSPSYEGVAAARALLKPGSTIDDWFEREAAAIEATARMLASTGTPEFHAASAELYGVPTRTLPGDDATPLALAEQVQRNIAELTATRLLAPAVRDQTAEQVAAVLEPAVREHFGDAAPDISIVDELSANAVATASAIKLRRTAKFTRKDAAQLLNHEAYIHVATGLNGKAQPDLPSLALGHPGTTRTQEGLAVFSEFVSGTLELDRLKRLAERVLAVQMACDGANFIDVYRWFLERTPTPEQAFEAARRIFRGAPLEGGAPFTKDCGYLSGLLSVMALVRAAFAADRSDVLGLLFVGKLDLRALPALAHLRDSGLCRPARFLPPWALDPGWLLTTLALSTFMASVDLANTLELVRTALADCPRVKVRTREEVLAQA
jgi:uncharacterized protein (TIGR02421 family)